MINKYQEAWKNVEGMTGWGVRCKEDEEDIETIREVVDKETPIKPKLMNCGKCGDFHIKGLKAINTGKGEVFAHPFNYCGKCGQKIDWSDEE